MYAGFKVEPQERMEKVFTEIDTLWQVSRTTPLSALVYVYSNTLPVQSLCKPGCWHSCCSIVSSSSAVPRCVVAAAALSHILVGI